MRANCVLLFNVGNLVFFGLPYLKGIITNLHFIKVPILIKPQFLDVTVS